MSAPQVNDADRAAARALNVSPLTNSSAEWERKVAERFAAHREASTAALQARIAELEVENQELAREIAARDEALTELEMRADQICAVS